MTELQKPVPRRCKIFNCDRRRGSFCCADCGYRRSGNCKNPCIMALRDAGKWCRWIQKAGEML